MSQGCGFLPSFFQSLNSSNIRYAVMRNYMSLPYSTGGSDLDIWVAEEDCQRFFELTMKVAEDFKGRLVSYIWKRYEPKICLMGPDFGIQLDVYRGFVPIGNRVFFTSDAIEKHIDVFQGVKVLNHDWSALEALLKEVLNTGGCDRKETYYSEASKALANISYEELQKSFPYFSEEYLRRLKSISNEQKSQALIHYLYKQGRKELTWNINSSFTDSIRKYSRLVRRPGYVITILGTDGSGKSAIYQGIYEHLEDAFHNKLYYRHLRPHFLPDIANLFGRRKENAQSDVCASPHAVKSSGFMMSLVRLLYYLQDYIWGSILKIWPKISTQASVFVMDRYYYDYYIDQTRSKINLPLWIIRFFDLFVPSPDIIICLGGEPEKIFERKPETSLDEVTRQTEALKAFCKEHSNAFWVNTTEYDLDTSVKMTLEGIAERMAKRFVDIKKL